MKSGLWQKKHKNLKRYDEQQKELIRLMHEAKLKANTLKPLPFCGGEENVDVGINGSFSGNFFEVEGRPRKQRLSLDKANFGANWGTNEVMDIQVRDCEDLWQNCCSVEWNVSNIVYQSK